MCCSFLALLVNTTSAEEPARNQFDWRRFEVDGRNAFMILPPAAKRKEPLPWVLYAPTFHNNLPNEPNEGWMIGKFLEAGIAVAGIDVGESYGSPAGRATYNALHAHLTQSSPKFAPKACLLARSRGGLMLYNWAAENADKVACIAGIYPVCDLRSYPGLAKACAAYEMTEQELAEKLAAHNPVNRLASLAKAKVPIFHIHGDVDKVVPLEANSGTMAKRYKELGGSMKLVVAKDQWHNMWHGFFHCEELVAFVLRNAQAAGQTDAAGQALNAAAPPATTSEDDQAANHEPSNQRNSSLPWSQFRGPNSSGIAVGSEPVPVEFGPGKNELWRLPLQSGHSSPCIAGDSIYVTTFDSESKKLEVVSIRRNDGTIRWSRHVPTDKIEKGHPSFNPASSTTASDGERVVAYFGSYGLICFSEAGEKLWDIKMPLTKSYAGNATSPAIVGDRVILYRGNHVDHFLLAVDKYSGKEIWKVEQAEPFAAELACTACPIMANEQLIVHTARSVQAFDISTGNQIWMTKCATTATSTPVIAGDEVIVAAWNKMGEPALRPEFPSFDQLVDDHDQDQDQRISKDELPKLMIFHRPDGAEAPQNGAPVRFRSIDHDKDGEITQTEWDTQIKRLEEFRSHYETHGMLAIRTDSQGIIQPDQLRTLATQGIPEVPSPLFHDGLVYFVKNGGVLSCHEVDTGKRTARIRTQGTGTHYASPVIGAGKLYSTAGDGKISVIGLGRKPKVLAVNDMLEPTYATPAIVDGTIYVRTHHNLYAFGLKESSP